MTTKVLTLTVPVPAAQVVHRLRLPTAFPLHSDDIVSVTAASDTLHQWVLAFRGGVARWVQRTQDSGGGLEPHRVEFIQVSGDFQHLHGAWTVTDHPDGCEVRFEVSYSTNVPHLAGAIESAAGRVLVRSAYQIISALAGPPVITAGAHHLRDLPTTLMPRTVQTGARP